jgi:hypothetical protein
VNATIDRYFKFRGRCGVCGGPDARHRVIDSIAERLAAGEYPDVIAQEFGVPVEGVHAVLAATIKLTLPPVPGLGVRKIMAYGQQVGVAANTSSENDPWEGEWAALLWAVAEKDSDQGETLGRPRLRDLRAALHERLEQKGMWWEWA